MASASLSVRRILSKAIPAVVVHSSNASSGQKITQEYELTIPLPSVNCLLLLLLRTDASNRIQGRKGIWIMKVVWIWYHLGLPRTSISGIGYPAKVPAEGEYAGVIIIPVSVWRQQDPRLENQDPPWSPFSFIARVRDHRWLQKITRKYRLVNHVMACSFMRSLFLPSNVFLGAHMGELSSLSCSMPEAQKAWICPLPTNLPDSIFVVIPVEWAHTSFRWDKFLVIDVPVARLLISGVIHLNTCVFDDVHLSALTQLPPASTDHVLVLQDHLFPWHASTQIINSIT